MWKAKVDPILEERRLQLWARYHVISDAQHLLERQMEDCARLQDETNKLIDNDRMAQLNNEFGTSLVIGKTYLVTDDMLRGTGTSGYFNLAQPAICNHIYFSNCVQFRGRHNTWVTICADKLTAIQEIEADLDLVHSYQSYVKYPCTSCQYEYNINEMEIYDKQFYCEFHHKQLLDAQETKQESELE